MGPSIQNIFPERKPKIRQFLTPALCQSRNLFANLLVSTKLTLCPHAIESPLVDICSALQVGIGDSACHGNLVTNVDGQVAYRMILEAQNEIRLGRCDPTIQMSLDYRNYWSQKTSQRIGNICCCPTFGIAIAGPWMCILGAIFLEHLVVQPLTPFIFLRTTPTKSFTRITRIFSALKRSLASLDRFYQGIFNSPNQQNQRYFPYFRQFIDKDGTTIPFTYLESLTPEPTRLVWKAKLVEDERFIVVKFTEKYNQHAHILCAEHQFAPVLHYFGDIGGGFHAVVMDFCDYWPQNVHNRDLVICNMQKAIELLHKNGYVFGDFRDPNVLVQEGGGVMLIDFDWAGTEGEATYPLWLNPDISWPEGVQPDGFLTKAHDIAWLGIMMNNLMNL